MGYHTEFTGRITVVPPLNEPERTYLRKFARSRRMDRDQGPYYVDGRCFDSLDPTWQEDSDVRDPSRPPAGQPGLFCDWEPTDDGSAIEWNQTEKFYDATQWMRYLIDHFLKADATAQGHPGFEHFTFDHVLNGSVDAVGEEEGDEWQLIVQDNTVTTVGPERGDPSWMCLGCLRIVESEDAACCANAETFPVWPA
ncbi:hypothetical protein AB0K51_31525 [Kitasatospora sp. NPDC049285]|uniref:hypothetical protein n=1 Tax=Kitasatospora sp. NPDC049285 TaxID=3157096 RepID=UPI00341DC8A2